MKPIVISGPKAEASINAKNALETSREQLMKTKKKFIDALHEEKRAEAALEEMKAGDNTRGFVQIGRTFVYVPREKLMSNLQERIEKCRAQKDQLAELEKAMVKRCEQHQAALNIIEGEIRKELAAQQNVVQGS
eukprot:Blabericola_migrator_1__988@NODE_1248_length_4986_cov_136_719658_g842_i0_p4_GENE_NODE_1248_length_4986_cov_136_719658_g842_i0NODE_1248_length_4986_cov_136_719658_g842_i0_p4_ORF_typecomplete_len134_score38_41Prefoldin_2/PF01920_20/8_2e07Tenui_NCP/PF04876_12/0_0022DUF4795/PF16043_5/3_8e02DUF4795/PF16043_5/0_0067ALIX_LYPXL_bnd/PF13949_6/0_064Vir_act_alpha_C/PF10400_9/2_3e03Vir_act_alpha_C/PF10400_9/0_067DUF3958/PF13125_6/1_5APG17/PF04108_12/1_7e02APG17/PF04108_12/0_098DUF3851/PF12962_7/15DUF3851/PF